MDDLIGIIVLILYFVAVKTSGKNKKKKKAREKAETQAVQFERAFERMTGAQRRRFDDHIAKKPQPAPVDEKPDAEGNDPCHSEMLRQERPAMRVLSVTQEQLYDVEEGEDPCHIGGAPEPNDSFADSPVYQSPIFHTDDQDAFAQDILRGVVMSEVLARPAQRRQGAGMKRRA